MNALTKTILVALLVSTTSAYAKGIFSDIFSKALAKNQDIEMERELVNAAKQINKQLPMAIDKNTRLDNLTPGPGLRQTYNYTMVIYASPLDVDKEYFFQLMRSQLKTEFCSNPKTQYLSKNGVTGSFSYKASDGGFITQIDITPKDCGYAN